MQLSKILFLFLFSDLFAFSPIQSATIVVIIIIIIISQSEQARDDFSNSSRS